MSAELRRRPNFRTWILRLRKINLNLPGIQTFLVGTLRQRRERFGNRFLLRLQSRLCFLSESSNQPKVDGKNIPCSLFFPNGFLRASFIFTADRRRKYQPGNADAFYRRNCKSAQNCSAEALHSGYLEQQRLWKTGNAEKTGRTGWCFSARPEIFF